MEELSDLPLQTLNQDGEAPKTRIKDVNSARVIFEEMRNADRHSSINRARVQAMLDGEPPYDEQALRNSGQGFRTNLNFGEGEGYLERAMSAYIDLVNSVEQLARIPLRLPENEETRDFSLIISEEFTDTIRGWSRFTYQFLNLCNQFVAHGVGITFHEDCFSWKWRTTGLGDFLIPRSTEANEEELDVACARREVPVSKLYSYIKNPKRATQMGWDPEAVKSAIKEACSVHDNTYEDWEKVQAELKNNDLYLDAKTAKVKLVHMWVKEFDGSVTHYIFAEQSQLTPDGKPQKFLFSKRGKYKSFDQGFRFFTYGIGTNGYFHGIRGLGYKIFPHQQLNNRIRSQTVDNAIAAGAPMIQPQDEHALDSLSFNYFGPFAVIPANINFIDRTTPNVGQTMLPVLNDLSRLADKRAGQYTTSGVFDHNERRSQFEVAAHLEDSSSLNETSMNLFYDPWSGHIKEVVKRFFSPNYPSFADGYAEVNECKKRCIERGVPEEIFDHIDFDKVTINRAVGNGSASARTVKLQKLNVLAGSFDAEGRHNLFRDQTVAEVGRDAANRYIPARSESRVGLHGKVAQLENNTLMSGQEIEVLPDEIHTIHLDYHLPKLEELHTLVESGEMEIVEAVQPALPLFHHSVNHLENIQGDTFIQEQIAGYNERLQQISEFIINGQKALEKLQREAQDQEDAEMQAQAQQQQISPEQQLKFEEHRLKLQQMQEKHQAEMMFKLQKHQQEINLQDAKSATALKDLLR